MRRRHCLLLAVLGAVGLGTWLSLTLFPSSNRTLAIDATRALEVVGPSAVAQTPQSQTATARTPSPLTQIPDPDPRGPVRIVGRALDALRATPRLDATASVTFVDASGNAGGSARHGTQIQVAPDPDGRFELCFAPARAEHALFQIEAPGAFPRRMEIHELTADRTVDLGDVLVAAGGTVRGRLVLPPGDALGEVYVALFSSAVWINAGHAARGCRISRPVDTTGRFRIGPVPPGRHALTLIARHWQLADTQVDVPAGGETAELVLTPRLRAGWRGTTRTHDGLPVAGAWVSAVVAPSTPEQLLRQPVRSDRHGLFLVPASPEDSGVLLRLRSRAPGLPDAFSTDMVPPGPAVTLVHRAGVDLRLHVRDSVSHVPVTAVTVRRISSGTLESAASALQRGGGDGIVVVPGLGPEVDELAVAAPGYAAAHVRLHDALTSAEARAESPLLVDLHAHASVRALVADASRPLAGCAAELTGDIPGQSHYEWLPGLRAEPGHRLDGFGTVQGSAVSDVIGELWFAGVVPGRFWIRGRGEGCAPFLSGPHDVAAAAEAVVTVRVQRGVTLRGRLEPRAAVRPGQVVRLRSPSSPWELPPLRIGNDGCQVDAAGGFTCSHVPPGRWLVAVLEQVPSRAPFAVTTAASVLSRCELGEVHVDTTDREVILDATPLLRGSSRGSFTMDDVPPQRAEITLALDGGALDGGALDGGGGDAMAWSTTAHPDAHGAWGIDDLRPGSWRVQWRAWDRAGVCWHGTDAQVHHLVPGASLRADLSVRRAALSFVLVHALDATTIPGQPIRVVPLGQPADSSPLRVTDRDGVLSIPAWVPGAWRVLTASGRELARCTERDMDPSGRIVVRWPAR